MTTRIHLDKAIEGNSGQLEAHLDKAIGCDLGQFEGDETTLSSRKAGSLAMEVRRGEKPSSRGNLTLNYLILTLLI